MSTLWNFKLLIESMFHGLFVFCNISQNSALLDSRMSKLLASLVQMIRIVVFQLLQAPVSFTTICNNICLFFLSKFSLAIIIRIKIVFLTMIYRALCDLTPTWLSNIILYNSLSCILSSIRIKLLVFPLTQHVVSGFSAFTHDTAIHASIVLLLQLCLIDSFIIQD